MRDGLDVINHNRSGLRFQACLEDLNDQSNDSCIVDFLGPEHGSVMLEAGSTLLVYFENHKTMMTPRHGGKPHGWRL